MPSERLFSTAGATISKLRSSLDSATADHLLFINKNMRHHPEFVEMSKATATELDSDLCLAPVPVDQSDRTGPQSTRRMLPVPESTEDSLFSLSQASSSSHASSSQASCSQGGPGPALPTMGSFKLD